MNPNKLILRTLQGIFPTFPDITLGSVMSHEELDSNFIYLKGETIHEGEIDVDTNLVLKKINGNEIIIPLSGVTISGITQDTYITGGTYNPTTGIIRFDNLTGGTFYVTGITDTNTFTTGLTYNVSGDSLSLFKNDGSILTTSGFTSIIPNENEFTTGGTFDSNNGIITYTSNSGNTFQVTGLTTGFTDSFVTGGTYNSGTTSIDFNLNNGNNFNVVIEDNNEVTTGGTLDIGLGTITYTTNSGTTFDVTGFTSFTDTFTTGGTYDSGTTTLTLNDNTGTGITISGFTFIGTGLEALDEGNGVGWRLVGRDPIFYGNVGLNGIDLSTSSTSGTPRGAISENSFAIGLNSTASSINSFAGGVNSLSNGDNSFTFGNATQAIGENSFAIGEGTLAQGLRTFAGGASSQSTGNFSLAFGNTAISSADGSISLGSGTASNNYSVSLGNGLFSRFDSETVVGRFNLDGGFITPSTPDTADSKLFTVGNGIDNITRNDAFIIYNNGATLFDPISSTTVGNATKGMYIYDEIDDKPKYHDGVEWKDFGITGFTDTFVTGGTYDLSASTINFTNNLGGNFSVTGINTNFQILDGYEDLTSAGGETTLITPNIIQLNSHHQLFRNGQLELFGLNNEYTITGSTVTFSTPLIAGEIIQFYYRYLNT